MKYDANHITTLQDLMAVRNSPSMYVGEVSIPGQLHTVKELTDNSNDEHMLLQHGLPIEVLFCFKEDTYQVIVIDKGRGIPIVNTKDPEDDVLRRISGKLHTSGKFSIDGPYEASTGTYGLGLKAAMALSENACILTCHNERRDIGYIQYKNGVEVNYNINPNTGYFEPGTIVILEPDKSIFSDINIFKEEGLKQFIEYMQFISIFSDRDIKIVIYEYDNFINVNRFYSKIKDDLSKGFEIINKIKRNKVLFELAKKVDLELFIKKKFETNSPTIWKLDNINKQFENDRLSYDIKLFLTQNTKVNKNGIMATVNMTMINDPSSHHILAVSEVVKYYLEKYIEDHNIKEYFKAIYKLPLYTIVRVRFKGAKFLDQTKKGFKDPVFLSLYKTSLLNKLSVIDENTWEELFEYIYPDIEKRYKENFNREYVSAKGLKNISLSLKKGKSFRNCISTNKNECELYIVEGKSALGAASQACNNYYQAIYAQQGKPKNFFKCPEDEFMEHERIKDLIKILGVTPKDTNLDNMNFARIYILADADYHGFHICALITGTLYKLNPLIIKEGRVRLSNPPLYSLTMKDRVLYLKDYNALMESKIESLYKPVFKIHASYKDSEIKTLIKDDVFINLCHIVVYVNKLIESAASFIGIEPYMVEVFLKHLTYSGDYHIDIENIMKDLDAQGIVDNKDFLIISIHESDITVPWKRFKEECNKYLFYEYNKFKCKDFQLYITSIHTNTYNKTKISITALHHIMTKLDPFFGEFEHFKGLGEMNPEQLRETCFDDNTRSSVQIRDIGDVELIYGMLDVDTKYRKLLTTALK